MRNITPSLRGESIFVIARALRALAMTGFVFSFAWDQGLAAETRTPAMIFQEANAAYRSGDYAKAARLFESLAAKDGRNNGNVFYNLGNACFKQKQVGRAILYYEKARRLHPRDRDLAANLAFVRKLLEYRVEDKRNWYLRGAESLLNFFTHREIGIMSLAGGLLFWLSWAFALYFRPGPHWGWRRKTVLFLAAFSVLLWMAKGVYDATVKEAVTLEPETVVRYGPSPKDQLAFRLGEGIKVRVKRKNDEWGQVALPNGEAGWVSLDEIGLI